MRNTMLEDREWRMAGAAALLGALVLLCPVLVSGSPASALREYKAGRYEQSLKEYQRLLERKTDDPRLRFNAGTAAYRNRQFAEAAKQFDQALSATDLKLQELAYYNRGNTLYHLGENIPEPSKKTEAWQRSLKDFESSLKLNPQDADAKFNYEFVKKKLEELKQQQKEDQRRIEPSEDARKAKARADEAVRRREYGQALTIMEKQLQQDPTTSYYSDYIKRLKEVTGVQENANP